MSAQQISPKAGRFQFDGGLNTKFEKTIIGDNESPDCLNVIFNNGACGTREGTTKLNTAAIGSFVGDGLYTRHSNAGAQTMIAFAGGSAWTLAGTTFSTIPSAQSVFTAGIRVAAAEYQNHIFVGNGGVIPYKYNGTDWTRHGVYPATTTMTVATSSAGVLTGDYVYGMTMVNSQSVESDISPLTATHTAAATRVLLSAIPTAAQSHGISTRKLYRTAAGGSTRKLLTTITDNTTTTYEDNIADASLGANAPTDNGVPPKYSVIAYHRDRLFVNDPANPNFLWYSDLTEPYTFGAANFRRFGDNTQDLLRCIAVDGENIVCFGDRSIQMTYMPSADDTEWVDIRVKSDFGCKSPFGIVRYDNGLLFPAVQEGKFVGFAKLQGDVVAPSATLLTVGAAGSYLVSDKIEPEILAAASSDIEEISGIVSESRAYLACPDTVASTENDKIYHFDFSISNMSKNTPYSWAPWTGLYPAQITQLDGELYYIDSRATGFVYKLNAGVYSDDGAAIDSYLWTKEFGGNAADFNFHKDFRYANTLVDLAGNYLMGISARVDSDVGAGNATTIDLNPGGSLWGTMEWGTDEWGGGFAHREFRIDLGTLSGKRIQFKFDNENAVNQRFMVHGLNFLANKKGFR